MIDNRLDHKKALLLALAAIPSGRVTSYGQLARFAGFPGAARWVARVLRDLPADSYLPWHRVVNSRGEIALSPDSESHNEQKQRLADEGVAFKNGKIDLRIFGWVP